MDTLFSQSSSFALNLALDKPALQSSTSPWSIHRNPEDDARGANNGVVSRALAFHTDKELNPWWQVDLEREYAISQVVLFNRRDYAERLRFFSVLSSLDGQTWVTRFTKREPSVFGAEDDAPFTMDFPQEFLARWVRIRLDGTDWLHFNEIQVFGTAPSADQRSRLLAADTLQAQERDVVPPGRTGKIVSIDGFSVFCDAVNYAPDINAALEHGGYEGTERSLVKQLCQPGDRVIEAGTAIGIVCLTAAAIVGAENVLTFDANPDVVADARENFQRNGLGGVKSRFGMLQSRTLIRDRMGADPEPAVDFFIAREFWGSRLHASLDDPGIVRKVRCPVHCFEDEVRAHGANVLICDIEGGEADLLSTADLRPINKIIVETHYWAVGKAATNAMVRKLILDGFNIDLDRSWGAVLVLER